jgi:hypothetical protein
MGIRAVDGERREGGESVVLGMEERMERRYMGWGVDLRVERGKKEVRWLDEVLCVLVGWLG